MHALGRHLHVLHHIYIIVEHWICRDMHFPQNDVVSDLTETMAATIHTVFVGMWILVKAEETPGRSVCFEYKFTQILTKTWKYVEIHVFFVGHHDIFPRIILVNFRTGIWSL